MKLSGLATGAAALAACRVNERSNEPLAQFLDRNFSDTFQGIDSEEAAISQLLKTLVNDYGLKEKYPFINTEPMVITKGNSEAGSEWDFLGYFGHSNLMWTVRSGSPNGISVSSELYKKAKNSDILTFKLAATNPLTVSNNLIHNGYLYYEITSDKVINGSLVECFRQGVPLDSTPDITSFNAPLDFVLRVMSDANLNLQRIYDLYRSGDPSMFFAGIYGLEAGLLNDILVFDSSAAFETNIILLIQNIISVDDAVNSFFGHNPLRNNLRVSIESIKQQYDSVQQTKLRYISYTRV